MKYLDKTGLTYLWSKIKAKIPTKTSQLTNDSNYITNTGSTSGNSGSATKLQNARTIGIGTGATGTATSFNGTANITIPITNIKEAYMTWGGKSLTTLSPSDMGCVDEFGHNKLAFLPANKISVEYTTDGGTTWTDYGLTDEQKIGIVSTTGVSCKIGKGTVSAKNGTLTNENCGNYKVRITITGVGSLYTVCQKILLNMSTDGAGGSKVQVDARTYTDYNAGNDTWRTIGTYSVAGWSGWNSLPISTTFGGANGWSDAQLRFILSIESVNTAYTCQAQLIDIRMIGINNWSTPSELARAGRLYTIDASQNAFFPGNVSPKTNNVGTLGTASYKWNNVYATTFTGNLSGNATTSTSATSSDKSNSAYILDTRNVNSTPNDYMGGGRRTVYEFKNISAINSPFSSGTFCTLKTVCQWDNTSGGLPIQIAYSHTSTKPVMRVATSGTAWGEWKTIALTDDIPTVNNATLTIQKNGVMVQTFTANSSTDKIANISVPTKTSDITNDSGFITKSVNNLTNYYTISETNSNFVQSGDISRVATTGSYNDLSNTPTIPTKTSDITNDSGFISNETDPVFSASASAGITSTDITNWNSNTTNIGNMSVLIGGNTLVEAINTANGKPDEIIQVKKSSFSYSGSGTGWKHGSFSYNAPSGYTLVSVSTRNVPSSDVNFFMFNIASTTQVYWGAYIGYANTGTVNVNLVYVKSDYIS